MTIVATLVDGGKDFQLEGTNTTLGADTSVTYNSKTSQTVKTGF